MGTSTPAPAELSREDLEAEVSHLRQLEERIEALEALVGTLGEVSPKGAALRDVTLADSPAGILLDKNNKEQDEERGR